jgi:uncharacterized membrane-anchored protein YhcB (DUF1043 family)
MNTPNFPGRSGWKLAGLCLALTLAPALARADSADPDVSRQQAVSQYVDGATKELDAYRQQITAATHAGSNAELNEAKAKLDDCYALVASLKTADSNHFDLIKSDYERTRGEMVRALQAGQKTDKAPDKASSN